MYKHPINGHADKTLLVGNKEIQRYLGISRSALWCWRTKQGFPVAPLPDGRLATTPSLIDAWLLARNQQVTRDTSSDNPKVSEDAHT